MRRVEEQFGRLGYSDNDQTPQLQGRTAAKDRPILGGLVCPRRP